MKEALSRKIPQADFCHGPIGALLRREGLYSSQLLVWRTQYERGALRGLADDTRGWGLHAHAARGGGVPTTITRSPPMSCASDSPGYAGRPKGSIIRRKVDTSSPPCVASTCCNGGGRGFAAPSTVSRRGEREVLGSGWAGRSAGSWFAERSGRCPWNTLPWTGVPVTGALEGQAFPESVSGGGAVSARSAVRAPCGRAYCGNHGLAIQPFLVRFEDRMRP